MWGFLQDNVEDEYHFILVCPSYVDFRKLYIKPYYYKCPSTYKLVQLLGTNNIKQLCNLGKYLFKACSLRNEMKIDNNK